MNSKNKNKKPDLSPDPAKKFIEEQNYAEQGFHLEDPAKETPDYEEEEGIAGKDEQAPDETERKVNESE
jgi:hypothetical protein